MNADADAVADAGVAPAIARLLRPVLGGELPVRLTAWDDSTAGPSEAPGVRLTSPRALRRLLWHPGELGVAQAFVTGELEVDAPVADVLRHVWGVVAARGGARRSVSPTQLAELARTARRLGAFGPPLPLPDSQIAVRGRLHSRRRDQAVIHHHYDITDEFYSLILDEQMAYSCGYVTGADPTGGESPSYRLEDAQTDKLDLVCRKLGLDAGPGMRLLDVGCGWGALCLYAAEHYGAHVTGVTIAAAQQQFIERRVRERGLADRVTVRLQDYRDVDDGPYDAIASLEMGEHAGERGYPAYVETLRRNAGSDTRILVQQMSRHDGHPGGGPFIESFIAPDMTMRPVGATMELMERGGLEVRDVHALREHYVWTVRAWQRRFDANRDRLVALVGPETVRVWELYLAGGALAFEQGRMGVDQILAVRSRPGPTNLPPVRPTTWSVAGG